MKISLEWLSEFVTWKEKDAHAVADRLTLSTAEVEEVEMQGAFLDNTCVGEVLSIAKHPDADRLCIAEVKTDKGVKKVVCGGTNLKEGMMVAFAHVGATVKWHGGEVVTLEPAKIRGVASEGMICAAEELELGSIYKDQPEDGERPIMDLARLGIKKAGASLREALGMTDTVLHINNTAITTRPDLFSHLGFARECVALGLATWKKPLPAERYSLPKFPTTKAPFHMHADDTLSPRYLGCFLHIGALGETPEWMKRRLESTGWRCVSLPVDITNYVSMEIGVPLHSFDADDIEGDVHMRLSKKGEKITTLDGVDRPLPEGALVLSDDKGIFDLLGIMGGLRSSTKPSTKTIYLHAASLDPVAIRRGIIGVGLRTEASTVYEKGVPPITTEQGFIRALQLITELVPGAKIISSLESKDTSKKPKPITLSTDKVRATLGVDISDKEIEKILTNLECEVKKGKKDEWAVTPPPHRLRDLSGAHDLTEEVGRIHGFDSIPANMPIAPLHVPVRDQRVHQLRDSLKTAGYIESVPLSFTSPALLQKCNLPLENTLAIQNPLGEETSLLQPSTLPRLLEQAQRQFTQTEHDLQTFQWGHVFGKTVPEHAELTALIAAKSQTNVLNDPFLRVKRDVLHALQDAGYELTIRASKTLPPYVHPGRCAELLLDGKPVGTVYEVHPSVAKRFDLPFRTAAVTLNVHALLEAPARIRLLQPVSTYPSIRYDETFAWTKKQPVGKLLAQMRSGSTILETVSVIDLYEGKVQEDGQYQLTLRFTYRSPEKTLTEEEVKKEHERMMKLI